MVEQDNGEDSRHILTGFDEQLARIRKGLLEMGGLVEQQLQLGQDLLRSNGAEGDLAPMQLVRERENRINQLDLAISRDLVQCVAMHHPMAVDMRTCISYMRIGLDLERIGDELEHVAVATLELRGNPILNGQMGEALQALFDACSKAVGRALNTLSVHSEKQAHQVIERDAEINLRQQKLQQQVMDALAEGAVDIEAGIRLIQVARSLERTGDHAKNLAQAVIYALTGDDPRRSEIEQKSDLEPRPPGVRGKPADDSR